MYYQNPHNPAPQTGDQLLQDANGQTYRQVYDPQTGRYVLIPFQAHPQRIPVANATYPQHVPVHAHSRPSPVYPGHGHSVPHPHYGFQSPSFLPEVPNQTNRDYSGDVSAMPASVLNTASPPHRLKPAITDLTVRYVDHLYLTESLSMAAHRLCAHTNDEEGSDAIAALVGCVVPYYVRDAKPGDFAQYFSGVDSVVTLVKNLKRLKKTPIEKLIDRLLTERVNRFLQLNMSKEIRIDQFSEDFFDLIQVLKNTMTLQEDAELSLFSSELLGIWQMPDMKELVTTMEETFSEFSHLTLVPNLQIGAILRRTLGDYREDQTFYDQFSTAFATARKISDTVEEQNVGKGHRRICSNLLLQDSNERWYEASVGLHKVFITPRDLT